MKNDFSLLRPPAGRRPWAARVRGATGLLLLALLPRFAWAQNPVLALTGTQTYTNVMAFVDQVEIVDATTNQLVRNAVPNGSFETSDALSNAGNGYGYQPTGASWHFGAQDGIAANGSTLGNGLAPAGTRVGFLNGTSNNSYCSQSLPVLRPGAYRVRLRASQRNGGTSDQGIKVTVNSRELNTFVPVAGTYTTYYTDIFVIYGPGGGNYAVFPAVYPLVGNLTSNGSTALNAGSNAVPAVTDVDGNGRLDLLVGNNNGTVMRYEQTAANAATFAPVGNLTTNGTTVLNGGTFATPTVTDVDYNGRLDLLVGESGGTVMRYEQPTANSPAFAPVGKLTTDGSTPLNAGAAAAPAVADVDGNGRLDLLVGNATGTVTRYEQPAANAGSFVLVDSLTTNGTATLDVGDYSRPSLADVDNDGRLDLLVGSQSGPVQRYEQNALNGIVFAPAILNSNGNVSLNPGSNSAVAATDVDGDGLFDLLAANGSGALTRYEQDYQPTDLSLSPQAVNEYQPSGTVVGTFTTTDNTPGDTFTYTLVSGAGSNDNVSFAVGTGANANKLLTAAVFNYQLKRSYSIRVRTTDATGFPLEDSFILSINDVPDPALVLTSIAPTSGPLDTRLTITGQNLTSLTSVLVGEVPARFTVASDTRVTAIVPRQATNQRVRISRAGGTAADQSTVLSTAAFQVARASTSLFFPSTASPTTDGTIPVRVATSSNAYRWAAPTVTDVDGDGLLDLLVGDGDGYVTRLEQTTRNGGQFTPLGYLTTDGTTRLRVTASDPNYNWAAPTVTDVDGNGRLDLLVGDGDGYVTRFEQTTRTGGVFASLGRVPVNGTGGVVKVVYLATPTVTDVDGDGLLDLLVGDTNGNMTRYEQTTALGSIFAEQTSAQDRLTIDGAASFSDGVYGVSSAPVITDMDGDGLLDLLVVANRMVLYHLEQKSAGSPVFRFLYDPSDSDANALMTDNSGKAVSVGSGNMTAVTDLDGDGLLDLLVATSDGTVNRFEQPAPSLFLTDIAPAVARAGTQDVVITGTNLTGATAVTVNGVAASFYIIDDSHLSFTVPAGGSPGPAVTVTTPAGVSPAYTRFEVQLRVLRTTPYANANSIPTTNSSLALIFSEPVLPASVTSAATPLVRVFSAQAGGRKAGQVSVSTSNTRTVSYTSTLSGRQANFQPGETVRVSVLPVAQTTAGLVSIPRVYEFRAAVSGSGRGNFQPPAANANVSVGNRPLSVTVGDIDGDGDLDMLTNNRSDQSVSVRLNDGAGNFTPPAASAEITDIGADRMLLGDIDGDGDLDVVFANGYVVVGRNDGAGNFTIPPVNNWLYFGPYNDISAAVLGDVDADGDLDLLTCSSRAGKAFVSLNDGTGNFTIPAAGIAVGSYPYDLVEGDVDGDGDLDLLVENSGNSTVSVRLNDGTGNFTPPATNAEVAVGQGIGLLAVGDIDNDGDLDLLSGNSRGSNTVSVRLNDGAGNFTPPATNAELAIGQSISGASLGDVDADGDLDLLVSLSTTVRVRLNDGTGNFTGWPANAEVTTGGDGAGLIALADVDGDGDLDMLIPNGNTSNVAVRLNQAAAPLPVELTAFTATPTSPAAVRLAWATASEKNSASFEVERSRDGRTFARVGTLAAAGSSSTPRSYELLDGKLPAGAPLLYYRLRQVDQDGTFSYSPVRTVALTGASAGLALFPNPAHSGAATLTGAQPGAVVTVLDALGRAVLAAPADAAGTAVLTLPPGLASGVYVVRTGSQALRLTVE